MIVDEINIKLIIVGDGGVGKTSIVNAYLNKNIPEVYIPTIGSNITKKEYNLPASNLDLRLNLWDLGGQKSFNPLNPAFFKNVDAAFLVFDLSKPETIKELDSVYLEHLKNNSEECIIFLVGNKLDLITDKESLKSLARDFPIKEVPLVFTSARTHENLNDIFELLAFSYLQEMVFKYPDDKVKGLDKEFLESINKDEQQLRNLFINSENVESIILQKKPSVAITKKVVETTDLDKEVEDIKVIHESLRRLDLIKSQIISSFNNNLTVIENIFEKLKKTPINSLVDSLDNAIGQIEYFKEDFELKLESLLDTGIESLINLKND
ncbi:MAG: Rab family GTPase [Promethearchaeota archaeon]